MNRCHELLQNNVVVEKEMHSRKSPRGRKATPATSSPSSSSFVISPSANGPKSPREVKGKGIGVYHLEEERSGVGEAGNTGKEIHRYSSSPSKLEILSSSSPNARNGQWLLQDRKEETLKSVNEDDSLDIIAAEGHSCGIESEYTFEDDDAEGIYVNVHEDSLEAGNSSDPEDAEVDPDLGGGRTMPSPSGGARDGPSCVPRSPREAATSSESISEALKSTTPSKVGKGVKAGSQLQEATSSSTVTPDTRIGLNKVYQLFEGSDEFYMRFPPSHLLDAFSIVYRFLFVSESSFLWQIPISTC